MREAVATKKASAREIAAEYYKRIAARNPELNAFLTLCEKRAFAQADRVDAMVAAGKPLPPLAGVPIAIKDTISTRGLRTTCGSKILDNYIPPYDATAVVRLEAAGAVILGKTNCDEFAMGSSTENSAYGPVKNPVAMDRVPGGSSGGSATAVAADLAVVALGTDTGGSIRQPGSFCGITSDDGELWPGVEVWADCVCVFAGSHWAIRAQRGRCGAGAADYRGARPERLHLDHRAGGRLCGGARETCQRNENRYPKRVLWCRYGCWSSGKGGGGDCSAAEDGVRVDGIHLPHTDYAIATYYIIATAEASSNLARYDGVRYGPRLDGDSLIAMYRKTRGAGFGPEVKRRIVLGTYVLSAGYYDAYYLKGQKVRALIAQDFREAFQKVDVIVTPTSPVPAFKLGERVNDPLQMYLADIYTVTGSLAGLPGISVPCGKIGGKLPVGLQVFGPAFGESKVLRLAHAFEQAGGAAL